MTSERKVVVLFNAPPNAGKDFAADYFNRKYGYYSASMKKFLYEATKLFYELSVSDMDMFSNRLLKEKKTTRLGGKSPREALIHVSENVIKPLFGQDIFGRRAVEDIAVFPNVTFSDCGFVAEAITLIDSYPDAAIHLVEITADGCSFEGDSRSYIYNALNKAGYSDRINVTKIHNSKDELFLKDLNNLYMKIQRGK